MSLPEIAENVTRSLQTSAELLARMRDGLVRRRTAWIAARPGTLAEPARALDEHAAALRAEDERRAELLQRARDLLPAPAGAAGRRHLDASALAAHLAPAPAARLQQAARAAADVARAVRTELAMGERLLRFSQRAHDQLLAGVSAAAAAAAGDVGGYDRTARRVAHAMKTAPGASGNLIDGRM
ncbi:MAG: hypothetical protein AB7O97_13700 [Planctomycetota bacterium]